jgi:hypothetical protein
MRLPVRAVARTNARQKLSHTIFWHVDIGSHFQPIGLLFKLLQNSELAPVRMR